MNQKKKRKYIAHTAFNSDGTRKPDHELPDHLMDVSKLAEEFSEQFGSEWGRLAGCWHDLGKYQAAFQKYIETSTQSNAENAHIEQTEKEKSQRITHSTAGAIHAINTLGTVEGSLLAYLIAGHHAGLPDWSGAKKSTLKCRLDEGKEEYRKSLEADIPADILSGELPDVPDAALDPEATALWIRMVFSALVDADFLDTERYMSPEKAQNREQFPALEEVDRRFRKAVAALQAKPQPASEKQRFLNKKRNEIYNCCLTAGRQEEPGIFSLTVPTGGGKTLSSLGFALEHARKYKKRRIIYAIPFTSIIEQNAKVFRDFIGDDAVLEHHSNFDLSPDEENSRSRLAAENWDAPLIVTTNVQLFESLHASRPSRCRKLHNLQDAVIILDEAQQLPRDFHGPIVRCMKALTRHFGVTWLLCTATQPDLSSQTSHDNRSLLSGLDNVKEIYPDFEPLSEELRRVNIEFPAVINNQIEEVSWQEVAHQLQQEDCVLAIVNTRRQARELYRLMPRDNTQGYKENEESPTTFHLSACMCAEHRSAVLNVIKARLKNKRQGKDNKPLRVISTQLVEAGVDVDFPVVYRAMAGLDSIAQSAGRCNREGRLDKGRVIIFNPVDCPPPGFLREAYQATEMMLKTEELDKPLSPAAFSRFFSLLNQQRNRDRYDINALLAPDQATSGEVTLQFREASSRFRMIDDNGFSIVVPYLPEHEQPKNNTGAGEVSLKESLDKSPVMDWLTRLEADPSQKGLYKKLQRYTVTVPERFAQQLQAAGLLEVKAGQYLANMYDEQLGLIPPDYLFNAEDLVL